VHLPQLPSDENLVGYWSFDDGSGTVAIDGSGNGNNGTLVNGPTWVDGTSGKCLDFDGTNDYVNCGSDDSLRITGDRTLCAWIELSAATYPNAATNWHIAYNENYHYYGFAWRIDGSSGKQYFRNSQAGGSTSITSTTAIGNNTKHFVAVVIEAGTLTFYLDGVADGSGAITAQVASLFDFHISNASQGFDGKIDEFRIYNQALTSSEIKALYLYPAGNRGTTISGNRIQTGIIQSNNLAASAGSLFNLNDGTMKLGGDTTPTLEFDGINLIIKATNSSTVGLVVDTAASPTADIAEFRNNGTAKLKVGTQGTLDFTGTMGNSSKTVGTDAPADWVQVAIGGTTYYLPAYSA